MDTFQRVDAQFMDFVGRHVGGGAGTQRPVVPLIAVRAGADTRFAGGDGAFALQLGKLRLKGGGDLAGDDAIRTPFPITRNTFFCRAADQRFHHCPAGSGIGNLRAHLPDGLVQQEVGRHYAHLAGIYDPLQLSIQDARHLFQAGNIGLGVDCIGDGVIGIEEARQVDIGAHVLDHRIGGSAPASYGDVAIGQGHAVNRRGIGAFHHFETGARGGIEPGLVESASPRQIGAQGCGVGILSFGRGVAKLAAQRGMCACIHAKAGGARGLVPQQVPCDIVQQSLCSPLSARGCGGGASGKDGEGGGCAQRSDEGAARQ